MLKNQTLAEWTNLKTKFNQLKANALTSQEKAWLTSLVTALHHFRTINNDDFENHIQGEFVKKTDHLTNSRLVGLKNVINPDAMSGILNNQFRGIRRNNQKKIISNLKIKIKNY